MKKILFAAVVSAMLTVGVVAAVAGPSPNSEATFRFALTTTGGAHPSCQLTITSTKDISNYTVNGVKTDGVTTPTVRISVANGDRITVKSGTSTAVYTVTGCAGPVVPGGDVHDHNGDGDHDGAHRGHDHHDADRKHDADDHHC